MALVQSAAPVPSLSHLATSAQITASPLHSAPAEDPEYTQVRTPSGYQRQMSFQLSTGSFTAPPNPYQVPANYAPASGSQTPQPAHVAGRDTSGIYVAVYSGISVYEMKVNGINVMRRRNDSWLNATQILKVAGVDKGKRTKVLEKEILTGKHEKVQGGYGKYQGTWVEYERGRDFCCQYGVEDLLKPLLEYDMGQDGQSKGTLDTPTKEQAMAAQRKKMLSEHRLNTQSPNGTFFKNISPSAANAVQAISKARFESPGSRPSSAQKPRPSLGRSLSQQKSTSDSFQPSSQQSMHSIHTEHSFSINGQLDSSFSNSITPYNTHGKRPASGLGNHESPRKRMRSDSNATITPNGTGFVESSFTVADNLLSRTSHTDAQGLPPLPPPTSESAQRKQQLLLSLVMADENESFEGASALETFSREDLDIPMDNAGHTALIWAATLGRIALVRKLVEHGAGIYRVNAGGETALMRAASAINNYDRGNFPDLLDILGCTLEMRDGRGRTVLHHIAIASAIKGRSRACKYYLESLLEFVVRQGSGTSSFTSSQTIDPSSSLPNGQSQKQKTIGLARFMSVIVNAQDMSGDTALNMAARNNNRALAQQLLEVGADPSIANNGGLKPTDFGVEGINAELPLSQAEGMPQSASSASGFGSMPPPPTKKLGNKVNETGDELIKSLQMIVEDGKARYLAESRGKQALIDEAAADLAAATERLQAAETRCNELKHRKAARDDLRGQIANLKRYNSDSIHDIRNTTHGQPKSNVKIGDADAGLWIDSSLLPPRRSSPKVNGVNGDSMDLDMIMDHIDEVERFDRSLLTAEQQRYITSTLSPAHFLRARYMAYRENNERLKAIITAAEQRSSLLNSQIIKLMSLSVGEPEDRVPHFLPSLLTALDSEQGEVDMNKIRGLIRRIEEGEGNEAD